jgi:N-acetylglutamate synthase/N-acetylornithine aminotransferase
LKLLEGSFDTALKIFDLQNIAIKTFNKIKVDADKNTTGTFRGLSVDLQSPEWEEVKPSSKQVYRGQVVGG